MHTLRLATAAVLLGLLVPAQTAPAQPSLTAQNNATVTVDTELDVTGDLSESGGGTLTFASGAALTLSGSSQQTVTSSVGPITVADVTLDNSNGAVLNSAVDVRGTLTLTSGALTTNGNLTLTATSETATAAIAGSGSGSVSGDVTYERELTKGDDASHFRMLGAPTTTALDDEGSGSNAGNLLSNLWTQATGSGADATVSEGNASVYDYDEAADLNGSALASAWTDVQNLDESVSPGAGVLTFLFADRDPPQGDDAEGFPVTLTATGSVQAQENSGSAITPTITYTGNDSQGDDGWNLIANPFMAPIDWESIENDGADLNNVTKTIYVYDAANGTYATYTADGSSGGSGTQGRYIAPFQAFFVKANGSSPDIGGIDAGDKAIDQSPEVKSLGDEPPQLTLRLRAEGDTTGETTVLRYGEDAAPGTDAYDAYQLEPLGSSYALVATEMKGTRALFDHQNRPVPAAQDTIDLALDITESGTFTLGASALAGLPPDWRVILKNLDSGARYDLGGGETVTFDHTASASAKTSSSTSVKTMLQEGPTVAKAESGGEAPSFRLFVGPEAALPVELAAFDATANGQEVTLSWQTASETDNAGFAIERRLVKPSGPDGSMENLGGRWATIGRVEGTGTIPEPQRYRFRDETLPFEAEQVTYRLRQTDLDGSTTRSEEITVQLGVPSEARLHAPFPNPARQRVTLRYEIPESRAGTGVRIALYDVLGRRVRSLASGPGEAGRHERRLDLQGLSAGTYFLRLRAGTTTQTQQLTIVR